MKAQTQPAKALVKTIHSTRSRVSVALRRLPRSLRDARRVARKTGDQAIEFLKAHPARAIVGLLILVGAARKLSRRV
jgi:hypothetical protein